MNDLTRPEQTNGAPALERLDEHRIRDLIEHAPDAILQVDSHGRIVIANRTTERLFGYSRDELLGQNVDLLVPTAGRIRHAEHRRSFSEANASRPMGAGLDLRARRKDGSEFPVEISLSPAQANSTGFVTAVIRDVTERLRTEHQIRALQESYMRELTTRQQEAERLNRLKSEFMASISHELRTPLHTIIGFAELLAEGAEGPLNEKQRRFVGHIQRDSEHLLELINDVLDLSRLESGGMHLRTGPMPLAAALVEAAAAIRPAAAAHSITLVERESPALRVEADPLRLRQILYNLLSNALKFTPAGGTVELSAELQENEVIITVADTGIGIPSDECTRIFDKFYQIGYSNSGVRQGTGLGLTICKQLVELQNGRIWVESTLGEGSRFHFTLPAKPL